MKRIVTWVLVCCLFLLHLQAQETVDSFTKDTISDRVFARIEGKSFKEDCTTLREDLRYLRIMHYNKEGEVRRGELICHKDIADALLEIFQELYKAKYPIERMVLVDDYGAPDGYTEFCHLMDSMGLGKGSSIAHPCSVESLKKIERPFTLPIRDWEPLAKGIKPHQRQYRVAVALRRIIKKRCTA